MQEVIKKRKRRKKTFMLSMMMRYGVGDYENLTAIDVTPA